MIFKTTDTEYLRRVDNIVFVKKHPDGDAEVEIDPENLSAIVVKKPQEVEVDGKRLYFSEIHIYFDDGRVEKVTIKDTHWNCGNVSYFVKVITFTFYDRLATKLGKTLEDAYGEYAKYLTW